MRLERPDEILDVHCGKDSLAGCVRKLTAEQIHQPIQPYKIECIAGLRAHDGLGAVGNADARLAIILRSFAPSPWR